MKIQNNSKKLTFAIKLDGGRRIRVKPGDTANVKKDIAEAILEQNKYFGVVKKRK